jgi:hypothetical protein
MSGEPGAIFARSLPHPSFLAAATRRQPSIGKRSPDPVSTTHSGDVNFSPRSIARSIAAT